MTQLVVIFRYLQAVGIRVSWRNRYFRRCQGSNIGSSFCLALESRCQPACWNERRRLWSCKSSPKLSSVRERAFADIYREIWAKVKRGVRKGRVERCICVNEQANTRGSSEKKSIDFAIGVCQREQGSLPRSGGIRMSS